MAETTSSGCPFGDNVDRRKSAALAKENTRPDDGAHWIRNPATARTVLRSPQAFQAGAGAESLHFDNPEHAPVFMLDGVDHHRKRMKTQKFLSPKAVADQHQQVMRRVTDDLLAGFRARGEAHLEDISFQLAVEVVGEILGLTESEQGARARRILRVLNCSLAQNKQGVAGLWLNLKRGLYTGLFFLRDVRPAMEARRKAPRNDAISFYLEEGYSNKAIIVECLTYGTAGMMTTREFIIMVAWYLFDDAGLCREFLAGDEKKQIAILLEILRLEPVAAMVHRRVREAVVQGDGEAYPPGELYGIDIRAANIDESFVGSCPFSVDPDRAQRQRENGRFMSFSDGPHNCPGWQVALHETRIFIDQLFRVPGLRLERAPDMTWNPAVKGYELRNALISCDRV